MRGEAFPCVNTNYNLHLKYLVATTEIKKKKNNAPQLELDPNTAGDTKILKVESPEISPTSARNNRRQDEGSSWGKSLKLLNITPRLFEE